MHNDDRFRPASPASLNRTPCPLTMRPDIEASPKTGSLSGFLAELLAEQRVLDTPVSRFSRSHDMQAPDGSVTRFSELIPLSQPDVDEQYAFQVDLDSCTGCKACVAGCHALNGLDEDETWRDVGLLVSDDAAHPFQQTITTACHHCADPACLNGCPVLAYEKDPVTGIVRHLDDQCIGCQYCVLKCPYDVPKYSERLGIVRKCDMCHGRLTVGEAPACAQACPTRAISIIKIPVIRRNGDPIGTPSTFLPCAPDPAITQPTTRYVTSKPFPSSLRRADANALTVQCAHTPLAAMLVLTQLGIGLQVASSVAITREFTATSIATTGYTLFVAGLVASVAHLGQPFRAWRIFLNLRRSWLSREAVVFGVVMVVSGSHLATTWGILPIAPLLANGSLIVLGTAAIACSAMIYVDTQRQFWSPAWTFGKFLSTAAISAMSVLHPLAASGALLMKLAAEGTHLLPSNRPESPMSLSARLLRGPLLTTFLVRIGLGFAAAVLLATDNLRTGFALFAIGEFVERTFFFRAVSAPGMPGLPKR